MTTARVVDTNVILVANQAHEAASPACVIECVQQLKRLMDSGVIVIDDGYRIVLEYQKKTSSRKGKGAGDVFVSWVLKNINRKDKIHQVKITERGEHQYVEFPDEELEGIFDAPDRKFVAVSNAHPDRPPVWQAVDCKWLDWWEPLERCGVKVEFLCREDACRFYSRKFPGKAAPKLP